jgi:hypothetical protein
VSEKKIIYKSVTFQNLVQNLCRTDLVTHLQVDLPLKNMIDKVDQRLGLLGT